MNIFSLPKKILMGIIWQEFYILSPLIRKKFLEISLLVKGEKLKNQQ
jgi:hypothetical protein